MVFFDTESGGINKTKVKHPVEQGISEAEVTDLDTNLSLKEYFQESLGISLKDKILAIQGLKPRPENVQLRVLVGKILGRQLSNPRNSDSINLFTQSVSLNGQTATTPNPPRLVETENGCLFAFANGEVYFFANKTNIKFLHQCTMLYDSIYQIQNLLHRTLAFDLSYPTTKHYAKILNTPLPQPTLENSENKIVNDFWLNTVLELVNILIELAPKAKTLLVETKGNGAYKKNDPIGDTPVEATTYPFMDMQILQEFKEEILTTVISTDKGNNISPIPTLTHHHATPNKAFPFALSINDNLFSYSGSIKAVELDDLEAGIAQFHSLYTGLDRLINSISSISKTSEKILIETYGADPRERIINYIITQQTTYYQIFGIEVPKVKTTSTSYDRYFQFTFELKRHVVSLIRMVPQYTVIANKFDLHWTGNRFAALNQQIQTPSSYFDLNYANDLFILATKLEQYLNYELKEVA